MAGHLAKTVYRVLADYSLRRFLIHAANPLRWPKLAAMRRVREAETMAFSRALEPWQGMANATARERHFVFRRWMASAPGTAAAVRGASFVPTDAGADPELRMRVDRLGGVLEAAAADPAAAWMTVAGWFETRPRAADFHRDSYSISERLANLILLWNLCEPPETLATPLAAMMQEEADRLLGHPEYHGENGTNNHILNNARALILAGTFFDSSRFFEAGRWMFENQFGRHVLPDGVLREGSSHYQWVIARWIVDVACAFRYRDADAYRRLVPALGRMLDVCDAVATATGECWHLPLVGDISPDFPPNFYRGLSAFGRRVAQDDASTGNGAGSDGLWDRHFSGTVPNARGDWIAADGSWARLARGPWSLLTHADVSPGENRPTHGHHDLFSFDLAFNCRPVIVDPGRGNYMAARDEEAAGILEEWHNTVIVGGARTGFVPRGYMPPDWLASFRPQPRVSLTSEGLAVSVDAMPGARGGQARRMFVLGASGNLRVVTQLSMKDGRALPVRLVLYLAGKARVEDGCARLDAGGSEIVLRWSGLGRPVSRPALRYVGYDTGEPCTRLEWDVVAEGPQWESVIDIAPTEAAP